MRVHNNHCTLRLQSDIAGFLHAVFLARVFGLELLGHGFYESIDFQGQILQIEGVFVNPLITGTGFMIVILAAVLVFGIEVHQVLVMIMTGCAVGSNDRKCIRLGKLIIGAFSDCRETGFVRVIFVHYRLNLGVLRRINLQTAVIEYVVGIGRGIALLLQIRNNLVNQFIHKVRVMGVAGSAFGLLIMQRYTDINILGISHGDIVLRLRAEAVVKHVLQTVGTTAGIVLGMIKRIHINRRPGNGGKGSSLADRQFIDIFSEICLCSLLDTIGAVAEVDDVQIIFQNGLFGIPGFQFDRKILLLKLTNNLINGAGFITAGKYLVLQKLLGDGTCTIVQTADFDNGENCTENTAHVDTVVLVEALILEGNEAVLDINRNVLNTYVFAVGTRARKLKAHRTVGIINRGRETLRSNTDGVDARRGMKNTQISTVGAIGPDNHAERYCNKSNTEKGDPKQGVNSASFGTKLFLLLCHAVMTVIHGMCFLNSAHKIREPNGAVR